MSYDLEIVCSDNPAGPVLDGARSQIEKFGEFYGPLEVGPSDVLEAALAYVLFPRWIIQISLPAARTDSDVAVTDKLARRLAKAFRGAVYDPQLDAVTWPRGKPKRYVRPAGEDHIRLVTLEWFLPASFADGGAAAFLDAARTLCREARPVRFGSFEPMQGRLPPDDDAPFIEGWNEELHLQYGGYFFWSATSPCFSGHVFFPDRRETTTWDTGEVVQVHPPGTQRAVRLATDWDGRALDGDPRWLETVVATFREMARRLNAFYAAGYVLRDTIVRRGTLWGGESFALQRSGWWRGIPPKPCWLLWFGGPYRDALEDALPDAERCPEGLMLRLGKEPMDKDQLKSRMPDLPLHVLAGPERKVQRGPITDIEIRPAAWMPEL